MDSATGFGVGLVVAALLLGLRHGIDWDHIAAITDIAATQESPRKGARLGTLYVLGHAAVVAVLGVIAIAVGTTLPGWVDDLMGRVVGLTLLVLGAYVLYTLIRHRGDFRMQSRWTLILRGVRRVYRLGRQRLSRSQYADVMHSHEHVAVPQSHHGDHDPAGSGDSSRWRAPTHRHPHAHDARHEPDAGSGIAAAVGVGMLHGIGVETPTQVVVFVAAATAGGVAAGMAVLASFLAGLILSNSAITAVSAFGLRAANRRRVLQTALGGAMAVISLAVGTLFVLGHDSLLPVFFAG